MRPNVDAVTARTYTLVVEDYGRGDITRLRASLNRYAVSWTRTMRADRTQRIGGFRVVLRGGFDGIRNTQAHALACNAGYMAWIDAEGPVEAVG